MCTLGQFFPEDNIEDYIYRNFIPKGVFYLNCSFTIPPKEKYLVLVYFDPNPFFFIINSKLRDFILQRPHLYQSQILIKASDYSFLNHDSYIDCSKFIENFSEAEVKDQLISDLNRFKGALNNSTIDEILDVTKKSKTLSNYQKELIQNSLG